MENDQRHYELRSKSRSRSRTPLIVSNVLLDQEAAEHHYDLRRRSRERSRTPGEVTSSRRSGSRSLPGSSSKTHEKNMETIEESKEGSVTESMTDNQSTISESSSVSTKRPKRRSERQRAKRQIFVNGESKEDGSDYKAERKRKSVTPRRILTSDGSSEEGEKEDPPTRSRVYEFYKRAGEWWNVFPKTDYTYSKGSQYRYEVAPGILAIPNMSRRPIHVNGNDSYRIPRNIKENLSQASQEATGSGISDIDTTDFKGASSLLRRLEDKYNTYMYSSNSSAKTMMYKKMHIEQYTSEKKVVYSDDSECSPNTWSRYPYSSSSFVDEYGLHQNAESDNELNEAFETSQCKINQRWRIRQWITSFVRFILYLVVAPFRKIVELFKFGGETREIRMEHYDTTPAESFNDTLNDTAAGTKRRRLLELLDSWSNSVYFLFVRMLVLDARLLNRLNGVRKRLSESKILRILWIVLLPLLVILGAYTAHEHFFTCVDSLRNVQRGVTETTYHIFNNITELTSFDYELLMRYFANLKNYSMHLLPSVNVSLPEMPPIGWNIKW